MENNMENKAVEAVMNAKSAGLAAFLGLFFGPLGLLYVRPMYALVGIVAAVPFALLTLGFGLFLITPICAFVGYKTAKKHNKALLEGVNKPAQ